MPKLSDTTDVEYPYRGSDIPSHADADRAVRQLRETLRTIRRAEVVRNPQNYQSRVKTLSESVEAITLVAHEFASGLAMMVSLWDSHNELVNQALQATGEIEPEVIDNVWNALRDTLSMSTSARNSLHTAHFDTRNYLFQESGCAADTSARGLIASLPEALSIISLLDGEKPTSIHVIAETASSIEGFPSGIYALQARLSKRHEAATGVLAAVRKTLRRSESTHAEAFQPIDTVLKYEAAVAYDVAKNWMTAAGAAVKFQSLFEPSLVYPVEASEGEDVAREYVYEGKRDQVEAQFSDVRALIGECKEYEHTDTVILRDILSFAASNLTPDEQAVASSSQ